MLNMQSSMTTDYHQQQQQRFSDGTMPKDCDGQIKWGFNIIANAFKSKVKILEEDLQAANEEKTKLEGKWEAMNQKLQRFQREKLEEVNLIQSKLQDVEEQLIQKTAEIQTRSSEFQKKERDLIEENTRLALNLKLFKRKANQLDQFRRLVYETIQRDEEAPGNNEVDDMKKVSAKLSTVHRSSVGSDFPPCNNNQERDSNFQSASQTTTKDSLGRRLFHTAKRQLSCDRFEQFLDIVRRFNLGTITTEQALQEAEMFCGYQNVDLYGEFKALLLYGSNERTQRNSETKETNIISM